MSWKYFYMYPWSEGSSFCFSLWIICLLLVNGLFVYLVYLVFIYLLFICCYLFIIYLFILFICLFSLFYYLFILWFMDYLFIISLWIICLFSDFHFFFTFWNTYCWYIFRICSPVLLSFPYAPYIPAFLLSILSNFFHFEL